MRAANELGMIVGLYLAKFGEEGLVRLGFQTYRQTFEAVGDSLNVKPMGLVLAVQTAPRIDFVQNPANTFSPVYRAYPTISVNWTVDSAQLRTASLL